jgi:hypothetical protein
VSLLEHEQKAIALTSYKNEQEKMAVTGQKLRKWVAVKFYRESKKWLWH